VCPRLLSVLLEAISQALNAVLQVALQYSNSKPIYYMTSDPTIQGGPFIGESLAVVKCLQHMYTHKQPQSGQMIRPAKTD